MSLNEFVELFPRVKINEPLKNYCNYKVGGNADYLYICMEINELSAISKYAKNSNIPIYIVGKGTNILCTEEGFRGLIVINQTHQICLSDEIICADSGVSMNDIITFGFQHNLGGLEPFYCLPGTIGGAVFGNAGSFGLEMKDVIKDVQYWSYDDEKNYLMDSKNLMFAYRDSFFKQNPKNVILKVSLKMKPINRSQTETQSKLREIALLRQSKQPFGSSCGSFFKNKILDDNTILYAGKMIEECGLKGMRVGDAQISEKHGNFIINLGKATVKDILSLAETAKSKVHDKFGIDLEEEVRIVR